MKEGDIVELISGSVIMTISKLYKSVAILYADLVYYSDIQNRIVTAEGVPTKALKLIKSKE